jgi:malate dehydrogenase (oxaloacetate-decarboxylating)(NADP+)
MMKLGRRLRHQRRRRPPRTVLIADTAVTERPTAAVRAIAIRSAAFARRMGQEAAGPFVSYTTS